ncbi:MAG: hypothetical protein C0599_02870 [Salinivirgaceae bacterium]|nr:MAG: hypothetical protein C0599_02870 [Salinivirgaceae bacterium]
MKNFFTILGLFITISLFSQKGIIITEDFSSGEFPPAGWVIDGHADNWSVRATNNAEGVAPEARFSWSPQFDSTSRVISPIIDATNITNLRIAFKHMLDNYGGAYTVGLATTSDGTTWNTVWSTGDVNATEAIDVNITNDLGSANFQFCFFFSGNSFNLDYWYIDDIMVYSPEQVDALAASININSYFAQGDLTINASLTNLGLDEITSFDATYQVNDGTPVTETFSGVSIATGASLSIDFAQAFAATAGDHNIKVWFNNINGNGDDDNTLNDSVSKEIHVASQTTTNFPLFEEFTSSTCAPCASFNSSTFTPFLRDHEGELAIIKYQMSWPGDGDPYYTEEGGVRRVFYGVSAVPQLYIGGSNVSTSGSAINAAFDAQNAKESFVLLQASHWVDTVNSKIGLVAYVIPFFNGSDFVLHAVVSEKKTVENVATNGETEFHHVMMKMLPNAEGTPLNLETEVTQTIAFTDIDLSGTNVEEMSDLEVVVFVQNTTSKEVFQSTISTEATQTYFSAMFNVADDGTPIEGATVTVDDSELMTDSVGHAKFSLPNGDYSYTIAADGYNNSNGTFTVDGDAITMDINLNPVGINGVSSTIRVYPIPAKNSVVVQGIKSNIHIYNLSGMLVKAVPTSGGNSTVVDVSDLAAGTYFVRSSDNTNVGTQKLIIVR